MAPLRFPRPFAAASLKLGASDCREHGRAGFPRPFAAASLKRPVVIIPTTETIRDFRGHSPRPH